METAVAKIILDLKGGMPYETLQMYVDKFMKEEYGYSDFQYCVDYRDFYTPDMIDFSYSDTLYERVKKYMERSTTK